MADPAQYTYESPLTGYESAAPLPDERNADGKSYVNPPAKTPSAAYERFVEPIQNGPRGGFDVHVYFYQNNPAQAQYARELWERIRREFPELRIYRIWDRPVGPHTVGMFEVNVFSPRQFGAFVPWLNVWRGPLSALVHPNTGCGLRDHTQRAMWLGRELPLDTSLFARTSENGAKEVS